MFANRGHSADLLAVKVFDQRLLIPEAPEHAPELVALPIDFHDIAPKQVDREGDRPRADCDQPADCLMQEAHSPDSGDYCPGLPGGAPKLSRIFLNIS